MRIIGGIHKGRKIKSVKGMLTRPTTDFVREALFNIISDKVFGSNFLDLFAGTGAVGLEALSRGAEKVVFVEKNMTACSVINQNLRDLKFIDKALVVQSDIVSAIQKLALGGYVFDIIFLDPPYYKNYIEKTLGTLKDFNIAGSIVVVQHPKNESFTFNGFSCFKNKNYGRTALTFLVKE
ncbi:MAG: 16S rRNA (guanine(966)-N(2))-methyltransferase RsmD [Thermoanaerobacteraceae bacterium]|nr:16S rRNA (guanine(966)-N(2))-methyltransferase RsmD [Thermoanaerobacteraceae bacterium]